MLKHEYKDTPTLEEALQLAIRVLNKTLDSTKLSADKGGCGLPSQEPIILACHNQG